MYLPCLETHIYYAYFQKVPNPLPHPPPARSLRSLAHIFQAPSSPPKKTFTLELRLNESNTKRLIQHKNTTKHTKSLNLPRASRADSWPNHISASLALPAISVAGGGGGSGPPPPPPPQ